MRTVTTEWIWDSAHWQGRKNAASEIKSVLGWMNLDETVMQEIDKVLAEAEAELAKIEEQTKL